MKLRLLPVLLGAALGGLPALVSAQSLSLTLNSFDPNKQWTTNSTNGVSTATVQGIAALQFHTLSNPLPPTAFGGQTSFELFCIELGQNTANIGVVQSGYVVKSLEEGDFGTTAQIETLAGITAAGIGSSAAQRLQKLYASVFGTTYNPSVLFSGPNEDKLRAAFQLAVWEVSHDNDFSLSQPAAGVQGFYVSGSQAGLYNDAIAQANSWLSTLQTNFNSIVGMELAVFHHASKQDLVYAPTGGAPIPEPSTYAALLGAMSVAFVLRRRRQPLLA